MREIHTIEEFDRLLAAGATLDDTVVQGVDLSDRTDALLATRCGGLEAVVRDDEEMLLVPAGSTDALVAGLRRLLDDADLRERLARSGRARVERDLSFRLRDAWNNTRRMAG